MIEKNCLLLSVHTESARCHSESRLGRDEESMRDSVSTGFFVASLLRMTSTSTVCVCTLVIAIFLLVAACKPIQSVRPPRSEVDTGSCLQLMTYNIRVGAGRGGLLTPVKYLTSSQNKLQKIVSAIRSLDPDIIGLQEVKGTAQIEFLANSLGMNHVYLSHEDSRFEWGLAVLSRFKITEHYKKFIRYDKKKPRVALICTVELDDLCVTIINVHFYFGDYDRQVEETIRLISSVRGPVILMGDLNLVNPDDELAPIKNKLVDTCELVDTEYSQEVKEIGTHRFGSKRLDYIFVDPNHFSVLEAGLVPEEHRSASDHIGYFACVRPKNQTDYRQPSQRKGD
jgi:endonuclease/exonuclease/phosphatase family metal-dependent hydrolase